ncbi:hypothetical protein ACOSQ3_014515 [Xanthoceras sorbifolium]
MTSAPQKRDKDKYCRFHRDHGHDTSKCFQLKDHIKNLIRDGHLKEFIVRRGGDNIQRQPRGPADKGPECPRGPVRQGHPRSPKKPNRRSKSPKASPINTIHGGPGTGTSNRAGKLEIREASQHRKFSTVNFVQGDEKRLREG